MQNLYEAKTAYWLLIGLALIIALTGIVNLYMIIRNRKIKLFGINYALLFISIILIIFNMYYNIYGYNYKFENFCSYIFLGMFIVSVILAIIQGIKRKFGINCALLLLISTILLVCDIIRF